MMILTPRFYDESFSVPSWPCSSIHSLWKCCQRETRILVWEVVRGFSLSASALLLFSSWTWCIAVFTRPAWLINSPLQGLFIICLCLFYNVCAIFRVSHFHNTWIFPQHHLFCFVEKFNFLFFSFVLSARLQPANSFCRLLSFDWFRGCSWSSGEDRGDKSKPLLIYYV